MEPISPAEVKLSTVQLCTLVAQIKQTEKVTRTADKPTAIGKLTECCQGKFGDRKGNKLLKSILMATKFDDATAYVATALEELEGKPHDMVPNPDKGAKADKGTPSAKRKREPKVPGEGKARRATALLGKTITANVKLNTRRAGTHGHKSLQIILDKGSVTVEKYLELGGRLNDLRWDMNKGNIIVE
jgi:hypothetical protein